MNVVLDEDGELVTDEVSVERRWNDYFEGLFECNGPGPQVPPRVTQEPDIERREKRIEEEIGMDKVLKAIKNLKGGKLQGKTLTC